jgi:acetyltransferase-like isoleucine patch superfamily enzyme
MGEANFGVSFFRRPIMQQPEWQYDDIKIYSDVTIGKNVKIGRGVIIYPNVKIGNDSFIRPYTIIGEPKADYYKAPDEHEFLETVIGKNSIIRSHSVIYEEVNIGDYFQTGHRVTIREATSIGHNCSMGTLSDLQGKLKIGNHVRIHSNVFLGQLSIIEDYVWIYPYVVLTNDPYPPMGNLRGVRVCKYAQIATSSVIMPGLEIGENALIGANTLVRKNVPPERVVVGNPGKDLCSVRDLRNDKDEQIYPWKEYLRDYRGYPWQ